MGPESRDPSACQPLTQCCELGAEARRGTWNDRDSAACSSGGQSWPFCFSVLEVTPRAKLWASELHLQTCSLLKKKSSFFGWDGSHCL